MNINELTDEQIEQLIALGVVPDELEESETQLTRAHALQDVPNAAGTNVRNGIYVASNPLEHFGVGMQRYKGIQREKEALARADALRRQQTEGRLSYLRALQAAGQRTGPSNTGGAAPMPGFNEQFAMSQRLRGM